jgi:Tfp pilus assembly protein PilF
VLRWRKRAWDRSATLEAAHRARARGRTGKAIRLYREVLAHDPADAVAHARVAPLLALRGADRTEALSSFRAAAQAHERAGFADRAAAVYAQAAAFFPHEAALWEARARLEEARGRRADARASLCDGAAHLTRRRSTCADAERLLRRALDLERGHVGASLALARAVARQRRRGEAKAILADLAGRTAGREKRRVRRAQFLVSPTPAAAWRWLAGR